MLPWTKLIQFNFFLFPFKMINVDEYTFWNQKEIAPTKFYKKQGQKAYG